MPIDLSPAGRPSGYPPRMRFWPWAATWFVCNVFGPVFVLLAWPKGEPARGLEFWIWMIGTPNVEGGNMTFHCPGAFKIKAASFTFVGRDNVPTELPFLPKSSLKISDPYSSSH
jgi:hypothetical protein